MTSEHKKNRNLYHFFLTALYLIFALVYIYFLITGSNFYLTEINKRPHHSDYRSLRPAGSIGHGFGVIGSFLMIAMLSYSLRKRTRIFKNAGHLTHWLGFHIFCGIAGPLLVILHSSFKVQGLIAVSFWSMIAVATSGILGRYIYLQIPRAISGKELDLEELQSTNISLARQLKTEYKLNDNDIEKIEEWYGIGTGEQKSLGLTLLFMITKDILRPVRLFKLRKRVSRKYNLPRSTIKKLLKIFERKVLLERRISAWQAIHQMFHYWHVIHKPFAFIMYIIMIIHILVAVYVGYIWIF
ncbi:MAG: hypothetical protein EH225_09425 [Calditrichaeota bacterium]|nr:hypothetical protein [Calditrichota bacterium]RQW01592.1 MAG: hypothetical protein EH225_09425 [Calditrichota bacterium]